MMSNKEKCVICRYPAEWHREAIMGAIPAGVYVPDCPGFRSTAGGPTLLPCPFCGDDAVIDRSNGRPAVICPNPTCFAFQRGNCEAVAVERWNRRATPVPDAGERQRLVERIAAELDRAYAKHGREPWSRHEFYGILLEEVDELWAAIKGDEPQDRVHEELVQVAAMCFRYAETGDRLHIAMAHPPEPPGVPYRGPKDVG